MTDNTHGLTEIELRAAAMCRMTPAEYVAFQNPQVDPAEFAKQQAKAEEREQTKQAVREVLAEQGGSAA